MGTDERFVRADRHDCQFKRSVATQAAELVGEGGIATEDDFLSSARDDVAVVAAVFVVPPAGAPMPHLKGFNFGLDGTRPSGRAGSDRRPVSPAELGRAFEGRAGK